MKYLIKSAFRSARVRFVSFEMQNQLQNECSLFGCYLLDFGEYLQPIVIHDTP